jgi:hypothetical protein
MASPSSMIEAMCDGNNSSRPPELSFFGLVYASSYLLVVQLLA